MQKLDYPSRVSVGRSDRRHAFWLRSRELLLGFYNDVPDNEIDAAVDAQFGLDAVLGGPDDGIGAVPAGAAGMAPAAFAPAAFPAADPLVLGGTMAALLRAKSMRWVALGAAAFARDEARTFQRDNRASCWLCSPVYQPLIEPSASRATAPVPSSFIVSVPEADDDVAVQAILELGTTIDATWPDSFGRLKRFLLDTDARDPETGARWIPDDGFDLMHRIRAVPGVDLVELDWVRMSPLEASGPKTWNTERAGFSKPSKPKGQRPRNGVRVALIDTGFDIGHQALAGVWTRKATWASFASPASRGVAVRGADVAASKVPTKAEFLPVDDWQWHGTAVAGILGAWRVQAKGVSGLAPRCRLIPIRVEEPITDANVAAALRWAMDLEAPAQVVNLSLSSGTPHAALRDAVRDAWEAGIVICAAAGNGYRGYQPRVTHPAAFREVIAVGACDEEGEPKRDDGKDEEWFSNFGPELSVLAPGIRVATTDVRGPAGYNEGAGGRPLIWFGREYYGAEAGDDEGDYLYAFTGTSTATPHVSALAALILARRPGTGNELVRAVIEETCRKLGGADVYPLSARTWSAERGYGVIDAQAALAALP